MAVLSNCIGAFTSRRSCLGILSRFVDATAPPNIVDGVANPPGLIPLLDEEEETWREHFHQAHFRGGNYTYRLFKTPKLEENMPLLRKLAAVLSAVCSRLPIIASLPVIAGFAGAMPILLYAVPFGPSCRHVWLVIIAGFWVFSLAMSTAVHMGLLGGSTLRRWVIIFIKDFFIGVLGLFTITLSALGAFNSCRCWGRSLFVSSPVIPLNTTEAYKADNKTVFPEIVVPVIFFQLCFCAAIIAWSWRGITLMRWNDRPRGGVVGVSSGG